MLFIILFIVVSATKIVNCSMAGLWYSQLYPQESAQCLAQ